MNPTPLEANWLAESERVPFRLYPYKSPGQLPAESLTPDLQLRMQSIKGQLAVATGLGCSCRVHGQFYRAVPPGDPQPQFSTSFGSQAVIDLQTGHLYFGPAQETLEIGKAAQTDWQYFLHYSIN
ncbi:hypothetical protein CLV58_109172 [Spirosoma oryzae]|uniref:Uncharacterized protein n=1 Tax=Spirosoma oryzae TaxID=1469603 RepID=A0A2T0SYG0_9BACT|nr:hypothetical protein [Spirosoma oryzae]PRY38445.1 hypothetical protein CLV58_109172 [Spirosoma oryzae]